MKQCMHRFTLSLALVIVASAAVAHADDPATLSAIRDQLSLERFELVDPIVTPLGEGYEISLVWGDAAYDLNLRPHDIRSEDFQAFVTDEKGDLVPYEAEPSRIHRGTLEGHVDSILAASIAPDGKVHALIRIDADTEILLQPVPEAFAALVSGSHVVYRPSDANPGNWSCGLDALEPHKDFDSRDEGSAQSRGGASLRECDIACDADNEFYDLNGSDVNETIADIERILAAVEVIYERDVEIVYDIGTIIVRSTEPDPYSATDSGDLLGQFRSHWRSQQGGVQRDIAHLFTGKNLDGSVIGVAWLGQICSTNLGYGLSQSRYTGNFSLRASLTAHELGHNWDSGHCSGSDCRIMCPSNGGCTGDVSRFGQSSRNQILAHRNSRGCLNIIPLPDPINPPFFEDFPSTTLNSDDWTDVEGASVDGGATNEPSGLLALRLSTTGGDDDFVASNRMLLESSLQDGVLSFWLEGKNVDNTDRLFVEVQDRNFLWTTIGTVWGNLTTSEYFRFTGFLLDGNLRHDRFRVRLRSDVDNSSDAFYVDDFAIAIPTVKIDLVPRVSAVTAGESFLFDVSATNVTTSTQPTTAWISVFKPDGSPLFATNPKFGPKSFNLNSGASAGRTDLRLRVPASTPAGLNYRMVAFVGNYPNEVTHYDEFFFQVVAP